MSMYIHLVKINSCSINKEYIDYIDPNNIYFKGKQNYPNTIVKMVGNILKNIVKW